MTFGESDPGRRITPRRPACGCLRVIGRPARGAVERIEAWRRVPAPLTWMAEARYGRRGWKRGHCRPSSRGRRRVALPTALAWFPARLLIIEKPPFAPTLSTAASRRTCLERAIRLLEGASQDSIRAREHS